EWYAAELKREHCITCATVTARRDVGRQAVETAIAHVEITQFLAVMNRHSLIALPPCLECFGKRLGTHAMPVDGRLLDVPPSGTVSPAHVGEMVQQCQDVPLVLGGNRHIERYSSSLTRLPVDVWQLLDESKLAEFSSARQPLRSSAVCENEL